MVGAGRATEASCRRRRLGPGRGVHRKCSPTNQFASE